MVARVALALAALAASASAHFTLDYPTSWGFEDAKESNFCGGLPGNNATRTPFPLGESTLKIDSHHTSAVIAIQISLDQNPTEFSDFNTTSNGTQLPFVNYWSPVTSAGEFCLPVNIGALDIPGVQNGTDATLQVLYDGGDGNLYQCASVTLIEGADVPSCSNSTSSGHSSGNDTETDHDHDGDNGAVALPIGGAMVAASGLFLASALAVL